VSQLPMEGETAWSVERQSTQQCLPTAEPPIFTRRHIPGLPDRKADNHFPSNNPTTALPDTYTPIPPCIPNFARPLLEINRLKEMVEIVVPGINKAFPNVSGGPQPKWLEDLKTGLNQLPDAFRNLQTIAQQATQQVKGFVERNNAAAAVEDYSAKVRELNAHLDKLCNFSLKGNLGLQLWTASTLEQAKKMLAYHEAQLQALQQPERL
jgi:hypothetical protein